MVYLYSFIHILRFDLNLIREHELSWLEIIELRLRSVAHLIKWVRLWLYIYIYIYAGAQVMQW
jgi:hypothetical protein